MITSITAAVVGLCYAFGAWFLSCVVFMAGNRDSDPSAPRLAIFILSAALVLIFGIMWQIARWAGLEFIAPVAGFVYFGLAAGALFGIRRAVDRHGGGCDRIVLKAERVLVLVSVVFALAEVARHVA